MSLTDTFVRIGLGEEEEEKDDSLLMALMQQQAIQEQMLETMKEIARSKSISSHMGGG